MPKVKAKILELASVMEDTKMYIQDNIQSSLNNKTASGLMDKSLNSLTESIRYMINTYIVVESEEHQITGHHTMERSDENPSNAKSKR